MSDEALYVWNRVKQLEKLHDYQRSMYDQELAKTRWQLGGKPMRHRNAAKLGIDGLYTRCYVANAGLCAYYENDEYACPNLAVKSHSKLLLYYCPEHQRLDDADRQRIAALREQFVAQQRQEIASVLMAYKQGVPLNEALRKQFELIERMGRTLEAEIARIEEEINDW